jgi:hypothetical protein
VQGVENTKDNQDFRQQVSPAGLDDVPLQLQAAVQRLKHAQ